MLEFLLIPFLVALVACVAGAARASLPRPDWPALSMLLVSSVAMGAFIRSWRGSDVGTGDVVVGSILGAALIATGPLFVYFRLGRALFEHRIVLALVWLATLAPLAFWLLFAFVATAEIVSCPQDAYECPF